MEDFNRKDFMLAINQAKRLTTEEFIKRAREIYGDRFDYSKTEYVNARVKLTITCKEHGDFTILPQHHIRNGGNSRTGCLQCGKKAINKDRKLTQEQFLKRIKDIKGLSFDKTIYIDKRKKVIVTCEIHGDYETSAEILLKGCGCPKCKSSKGEALIKVILDRLGVEYIQQKEFKDLFFKRTLKFDFYLPDYNACIEFDGEQHFKSVKYWGGEENFKNLQIKDDMKNIYCQKNYISLLRLRFDEVDLKNKISIFISNLEKVTFYNI